MSLGRARPGQQSMAIKRLLIANRGEVAIRIANAARELKIYTIAIFADEDRGHSWFADESIELQSAAAFTDIELLVKLAQENTVDSVALGYGFLSESAAFCNALGNVGIRFVGPRSNILEHLGDKSHAKEIATICHVPTLPTQLVSTAQEIESFATSVSYPIIIKALDGGGGRGIRIVSNPNDIENALARCLGESPSGRVFVEKAAIHGFRHVEVQILGDEYGNVTHLFERECSIQRRFQKLLEFAPSGIERDLVTKVIDSALRMAKYIKYNSLGTFEFLVNPKQKKFYFMECNPRLQVEHTVTEEITEFDLVHAQLALSSGSTLDSLDIPTKFHGYAVQTRLTAEDPNKDFVPSSGTISNFIKPHGRGVRVETALGVSPTSRIDPNYDNLLVKVVTRGANLAEASLKNLVALRNVHIEGVITNASLLMAILENPGFIAGEIEVSWLEKNLHQLLESSRKYLRDVPEFLRKTRLIAPISTATSPLKKGDSWEVEVQVTGSQDPPAKIGLQVEKILKNGFPDFLSADITLSPDNSRRKIHMKRVNLLQTSHPRGDPKNKSHVILPFSGVLVDLLVEDGDLLEKGDVVAVVKQMKMELEVRCVLSGVVSSVVQCDIGETISEGALLCVCNARTITAKL